MTHRHYLLFCLLSFVLSLNDTNAQSLSSPIICGNQVFEDIVKRNYPELENNFHSTFDQVKHNRDKRTGPYTIKVIVHIVWNEDEENLNDSIIIDQFRVLNEDYNQLNLDINQVRSQFEPFVGNAEIEFELAGIERVHTSELFSVDLLGTNLLSEVKHSSMGGSDAYDPNEYLNIWVCKIQPIEIFGQVIGQILGFAFPPAGLPNWPDDVSAPTPEEDGVVIDYRVFGSNNPNSIVVPGLNTDLVVLGRTAVHEVGHYLGLRHIWGDGGTFGPNDCNQSDGIDDTPFANTQSNFDCDLTRNSCSGLEPIHNGDPLDMIENFMDYSSEDCLVMFTQGQVAHMQGVLDGPRRSLVEDVSSVNTIAGAVQLNVTPNPASEHVNITIPKGINLSNRIQVYDFTGQLVRTYRITNTEIEKIDISGFPTGRYVIAIHGAGELFSGSIVKQ